LSKACSDVGQALILYDPPLPIHTEGRSWSDVGRLVLLSLTLPAADISEHNIRVEVVTSAYGDDGEAEGDEEEEDDDGDGIDDDVPDRHYVKNSSQQMSDKARVALNPEP